LRLIARGRTPKPDHLAELGTLVNADAARTGTRPAHFGDGFVDTAVYDGARLGAGVEIDGPALIEEPFTVVVVPPGARARIDETGTYHLDLP
jgi:N-methylhydantoinase A